MADYNTVEYWDRRTRENREHMKNLLFHDPRFHEYEKRTAAFLAWWKDLRVLDVACGPGRFCGLFENYVGIDFSPEMVRLAQERNPGKDIRLHDAREPMTGLYDAVFEVNSLKSLGMTKEQFIEKYKPIARRYVACIEADFIHVEMVYGTH